MADLICPDCGAGGFKNRTGYVAHTRTHQAKVPCPDCGTLVGSHGLGSHRRTHGVTGQRNRPTQPRTVSPWQTPLDQLLPGAPDLTARLAAFIPADPGQATHVVIGATFGPRLCHRVQVGQVVVGAHEPCLVLGIDVLEWARNLPAAS